MPQHADGGLAVSGRRQFVCLDGGIRVCPDRLAIAQDRVRREASPGRSRRLYDAIRKRFPTDGTFEAWNEALAERHPRLALQLSQIFTDIDRGHTPTAYHLYALALAADWSFERVCQEFDVDFLGLPQLHAALGADRTHVDLSGYGVTGSLLMPTDLAPGATRTAMSLTELVGGWSRQPASAWAAADQRLTGQMGHTDNLAYPRLPSGSLFLVDTTSTRPTDQSRYYLVQHPNGFSCARTAIDGGMLSLLSEDRDRYPRLDFSLRDVRVLGRIVAFGGRVGRLRLPAAVSLGDLMDVRRPLIDAQKMREMSSPALLRDIWARRELSFSRFERKVHMLRLLAGSRFTVGRGHMHDLMHAATPESVPSLNRLFLLAAIFLLHPRDLLRGYGLPVDDLPTRQSDSGAASEKTRQMADRLRAHPIVAHLLRRGWDLPWLLSLYRGPTLTSRLFYLDDISSGLTPLLKPDAFVSINTRQRQVAAFVKGRPVETLRDWERPIYLLQTSTRHRFVCGYCEERGDVITVVPHPDAPSQRALRFRKPDQAIVLGRVTHVATLME